MQTKKEIQNYEEIQTLAKTFAKNLIDQGYEYEDLINAATAIVDQAIVVIEKPKIQKKPPPDRTHLQVVKT